MCRKNFQSRILIRSVGIVIFLVDAGNSQIFLNENVTVMTRGNTILLAALAGAGIAALLASYLTTESGRQVLNQATDALKDITAKATELAKSNAGEILQEAKTSVGNVVKEKIAEKAMQ